MSNIADDVRKAGLPNATPDQALAAGQEALAKLGAHQKKMKQPFDVSVNGLGKHLSSAGAAYFGPGLAALEKLSLQGMLP
jgi:hypothetical protein